MQSGRAIGTPKAGNGRVEAHPRPCASRAPAPRTPARGWPTSCTACASPLPTSCARSRAACRWPDSVCAPRAFGCRPSSTRRWPPHAWPALSGAALHAAQRRDRPTRCPARPLGGSRRPTARGAPRHRHPDRRAAAGHRRRQPDPAAQRRRLRHAGRHGTHSSLVRQDRAPASQPWWRPPGQLRALHAGPQPPVPRPAHPGLCSATDRRGQDEVGDHALSEALPGVPEEWFAGQATGSIQRTPPRWTRVRSRITTATIVTLPQVGQRMTSPALR